MIKISPNQIIDKFANVGINSAPYIKFLLELSESFLEKDQKIRQEIKGFLRPYQLKMTDILIAKYGPEGIDLIKIDNDKRYKSIEDLYLESLLEGRKASCSFSVFDCGAFEVLSCFAASEFYSDIIANMSENEKQQKIFTHNYKNLWKAQEKEYKKLEDVWCELLIKYL